MGHFKTRARRVRVVLILTAISTLAAFAIPSGVIAALLPPLPVPLPGAPATPTPTTVAAPTAPQNPLAPIQSALGTVTKTVQDLLSQAGPTQAALQASADELRARIEQIVADGQADPTTIPAAIQALADDPTGVVDTSPLLSLALTLAAKAAQPICPILGALAAETSGVQVPTMPDYSIFGPLADAVKTYDQTAANTIYETYVAIFTRLLEPIAAPAPADAVVSLAQVLLQLITINWKTTYYPADGGTPFVRNTPGFLYLPTLIDVDNNLGFDVCANNGFDLLGDQSVALQIDRIPLADPNMRADISTDFLFNVLHSGYAIPAGSAIPSMFETTHTLGGQPFHTKVQWPGGSLNQFLNLAGALQFNVNTVKTPSEYRLSSAAPAGSPANTTVTRWTSTGFADKFTYELFVPSVLKTVTGASGPAPSQVQFCSSRSAYCSNEPGAATDPTINTHSLHFKANRVTNFLQWGALGSAANTAVAPTSCPTIALLAHTILKGASLHFGFKTGAGGRVWIDSDNANVDGCTALLSPSYRATLPVGFVAQDRLVTLATSGSPLPAASKSGTITCPAGTAISASTTNWANYLCAYVATVAPAVSGSATVGSNLTGSNGTWTPASPAPTFSYQWLSCDAAGANCVPISGATTNAYTVTSSDVGKRLRMAVTASGPEGSTTANSGATAAVV